MVSPPMPPAPCALHRCLHSLCMKREPALPKCLFMLPTTLRAQIEANKLPLRQRSLPAMPTPIALASWNGIPPRCARGRAPILALAVIACSLLWAGSAPAGPNLQPDEAVAVSPEEQPDAMPGEQGDDTPTRGQHCQCRTSQQLMK